MKTTLLAALLVLPVCAPSPAAGGVHQGERISTLIVYGNDPCPRSADDEIVVCARQPESERYRIPAPLRVKPFDAARDGSWAGTAKVLEFVSRQGIPNSCSPQGSYGQSGCFQRFLEENRQARAAGAP